MMPYLSVVVLDLKHELILTTLDDGVLWRIMGCEQLTMAGQTKKTLDQRSTKWPGQCGWGMHALKLLTTPKAPKIITRKVIRAALGENGYT